MDRCALFVDAGYVLADGAMAAHGTRNRESVSWDYAGVLQFLSNVARDRTGLPLLRCYWYEATVEGRRTREHDILADLPGVKLRLGRMRPGHREGVESEIHRDLTTLARHRAISEALVVSAEEDLAQVIADVQDLGIRVTIIHITADRNWTIPRTLRQECDGIVEIGEAHLRPYVELVAGAEPGRDEDPRQQPVAAYAAPTPGNGHGPALSHEESAPAGSSVGGPPIYTAPVIAEFQRAAAHSPGNGAHGAPPAPESAAGPGSGAGQARHPGMAHATLPPGQFGRGPAAPPPQDPPSYPPPGNERRQQPPPGYSSGGAPGTAPAAPSAPGGYGPPDSSGLGQQPGQRPQPGMHVSQTIYHPAPPAPGGQPSAPAPGARRPYPPAALPAPGGYGPPEPGPPRDPRFPAAPQPAGSALQQHRVPPQGLPQRGGSSLPVRQGGPAGAPAPVSVADAVQAAHGEGFNFGRAVARDAPALWLEAVLARKPRMPSDLEARLLQDSSLPIDSLLHDEVRHALRRGFWDALERSRH